MSQNHYQVLGVSATATAREIKLAYKRLAVQYHPDKHHGSTLYEDLFKAVAAAYQILGDPGRRAQYDFQLQAAARRVEEARRQQQFRNQGQRVYGVPMPPPAPLRTRRPAGSQERHYRTIPKQHVKFTRRDFQVVAIIVLVMILVGLAVKFGMDRAAATRSYQEGLVSYTQQKWKLAYQHFSDVLRYRSGYAPALRRKGEIEELVFRNPQVALATYQEALTETTNPQLEAHLLLRVSKCYRALKRSDLSQSAAQRALSRDSTLVQARLLRGEALLFKHQYSSARQDFDAGLRHAAKAPAYVNARLLLYRGLTHFKQKDYRAARADYWQVLATYPNHGQVYFLLGRVAQQERNPVEACEFFRRAVVQGYRFAELAQDTTCH